MINIYVDADSCPVKQEVLKVSMRHGLEVYMVSNQWTTQIMGAKVYKILVPAGSDAADDWIVQHIAKNDIAITADILLAQRCVNLGAYVISPQGKKFTEENIGITVAVRDLNAHLRETGEIFSYNQSFSKQDRSRFLQELESAIQKIKLH
jgi:uncharacterized protein YaiI (UPF0178 family)